MMKVKTICTVLGIEAALVGLVVSVEAYGNHRYCKGYTNGLLEGASAGLTMSKE